MHSVADSAIHNGPLSSALAGTFRGKLCDVILRSRTVTTFEKDQVIYDAADQHQTFFFLVSSVNGRSMTDATSSRAPRNISMRR